MNEPLNGMLSGTHYGSVLNVRCPVCGFDYSHVDFPASGERHDALVVVFDGECGHRWELVIQPHKGVNLLEGRILSLPEADDIQASLLGRARPVTLDDVAAFLKHQDDHSAPR